MVLKAILKPLPTDSPLEVVKNNPLQPVNVTVALEKLEECKKILNTPMDEGLKMVLYRQSVSELQSLLPNKGQLGEKNIKSTTTVGEQTVAPPEVLATGMQTLPMPTYFHKTEMETGEEEKTDRNKTLKQPITKKRKLHAKPKRPKLSPKTRLQKQERAYDDAEDILEKNMVSKKLFTVGKK